MDKNLGKRILAVQKLIVQYFNTGHWGEVGLLTGHSQKIDQHHRLLRSLSWQDQDYAGNVLEVLRDIAAEDPAAFATIERYTNDQFGTDEEYISPKPAERRITFAPNVFTAPDVVPEQDLAVAMMPFGKSFDSVYDEMKRASTTAGFRCLRADDMWEDSIIIQDIFTLIFRAYVVIVDFTGRNPNVMYETGIAHTLGKHVVPIAQSLDDVPFDLRHHRVLKYLDNGEGRIALQKNLTTRLQQWSPRPR